MACVTVDTQPWVLCYVERNGGSKTVPRTSSSAVNHTSCPFPSDGYEARTGRFLRVSDHPPSDVSPPPTVSVSPVVSARSVFTTRAHSDLRGISSSLNHGSNDTGEGSSRGIRVVTTSSLSRTGSVGTARSDGRSRRRPRDPRAPRRGHSRTCSRGRRSPRRPRRSRGPGGCRRRSARRACS